MAERDIVEEKIKRKEQEIQTLEEKLKTARVYLQALHDINKALAKENTASTESILREGSAVAQARDLIQQKGTPLHVNDILEGIGRGLTRESRASLTSSLAAYVRRREIFTRPAPNTFGLLELGYESSQETDRQPEPPDGFGS